MQSETGAVTSASHQVAPPESGISDHTYRDDSLRNGSTAAIGALGAVSFPAADLQHVKAAPPAETSGGAGPIASELYPTPLGGRNHASDAPSPKLEAPTGVKPVVTHLRPTGPANGTGDWDRDDVESERHPEDSQEPERDSPKGEEEEAGPSGRLAEDGVGVAAGRRTVSIRPKDWAGGVVWAKLAKYPWWPAQVLEENDPWIPNDTEMPRRGAIPVRFFGTYDFAWIESQRAICPFDQDYDDHSSKSKQKSFTDALAEASHFQKTQELPDGFNEDSTPSPRKAPRKSKGNSGKGKAKRADAPGGGTGKGTKRAADDSNAHRRSVRERQDSIMQTLALVPPADSPYSHSINLDGVRKLIELQKAGQYPPPAPAPVQAFAQPHTYMQPFSAAQFSASQFAPQQQQLQQLHQQLTAQASAGRPQWPLHFQAFNPQLPMSFFQSQGGVQGALLAAASQGQFPPKQF